MTHLVMIVPNTVNLDSRVHKVARSAQDAGYDVTVLGAANRDFQLSTVINGVLVLRVPRVPHVNATPLQRRARGLRKRAKALPLGMRAGVSAISQRVSSFEQRRVESIPHPYRAIPRHRHRVLVKKFAAREDDIARWTARFVQPIVDLRPDLIYVHDAPLLLAAHIARDELVRLGHAVKLVADVHEWWPGVPGVAPDRLASRVDLENEYLPRADKVITVSDTLADWLRERLDLAANPAVVENGAVAEYVPDPSRLDVRAECGLGSDVPLLVYAGSITEARGLQTILQALATLPAVHLCLVAGTRAGHVAELEEQASQLGLADRLHIQPFVSVKSVPWYLSTATAGLAPFRRFPSHDSALATKISEYIVARLPLIVSDCTSQARYVREHHVGQVFEAEQVDSARNAIVDVVANADRYRARIDESLVFQRTWEHHSQRLLQVFQELLGSPTRTRWRSPQGFESRLVLQTLDLHSVWSSGDLDPGRDSARFPALFGADPEQSMDALARLATREVTRH